MCLEFLQLRKSFIPLLWRHLGKLILSLEMFLKERVHGQLLQIVKLSFQREKPSVSDFSVCMMGRVFHYPKCSSKAGVLGLWNETKLAYLFPIPATLFLQNLNCISVPRMHANNAEVVKRKEEKLFSYTLLFILPENTISATTYKYNIPWVKQHRTASIYLLHSKRVWAGWVPHESCSGAVQHCHHVLRTENRLHGARTARPLLSALF